MATTTTTTKPATKPADKKSESIAPLTMTAAPLALLRAALACVEANGDRSYMAGVYLHRHENVMRIVGTDGHRMLVASYEPIAGAEPFPKWLDDGVIIAAEGLKPRLSLLDDGLKSLATKGLVTIGYAHDAPTVELTNPWRSVVFRVQAIEGPFLDYRRFIASASAALSDQEHSALDAQAFDGKYLKGVAEIAKILDATRVNVLSGPSTGSEPSIITFGNVEGVALYLMPMRLDGPAIGAATAAILAPALKSTVAALRAHQTRWQQEADKAKDATARKKADERVADFAARIAAILKGTGKALPKPEAKPGPAAPAPAPTSMKPSDAKAAEASKPAATKPPAKPAAKRIAVKKAAKPVAAKRRAMNGHAHA